VARSLTAQIRRNFRSRQREGGPTTEPPSDLRRGVMLGEQSPLAAPHRPVLVQIQSRHLCSAPLQVSKSGDDVRERNARRLRPTTSKKGQ
jgi:hypothetical protein